MDEIRLDQKHVKIPLEVLLSDNTCICFFILSIIPQFCRFCSFLEDGIFSRISSETGVSWEYCFSRYPGLHNKMFTNRGDLDSTVFQDTPVCKPGYLGSTVFQDTPVCEPGYLGSTVFQDAPCLQTILLLWFGSRGESRHLPVTRVARYRHYSPFVVWINELKFCKQATSWKTVLPRCHGL